MQELISTLHRALAFIDKNSVDADYLKYLIEHCLRRVEKVKTPDSINASTFYVLMDENCKGYNLVVNDLGEAIWKDYLTFGPWQDLGRVSRPRDAIRKLRKLLGVKLVVFDRRIS